MGEQGGWGRFGGAMAIFTNLVIGLGYGSGHQRGSACGTQRPFVWEARSNIMA